MLGELSTPEGEQTVTNEITDKQNELIKWSHLEPWKRELAEMVIKAHKERKLMKCHYQQLIFEPIRLMEELINGHFIWGVDNWEIVDRKDYKCVDYPRKKI